MKRRAWIIALIAFAMLFVAMPTRSALAACTSPAGEESKTIYDTTIHAVMYCNGTNWVTVGAGIATGTISAFASTTCPAGWTEYVAARGRFLRGIDNGAGIDPAGTRAPGNQQADALQNMTGSFKVAGAGGGLDTAAGVFTIINAPAQYPTNANGPTAGVGYAKFDASLQARTAIETRPTNVAVLFCQYTGAGGGGALPTTNSLDFTEFKDAMALDASTDISVTGTKVLSITNTGTANSLVVNDQTSDTTPFVIDASGNVGIGTSTPNYLLEVGSGAASASSYLFTPGIVAANGYRARAGHGGAFGSNIFNIYWSGSSAQLWIDTTNVGNISLSSDRRLKRDISTAAQGGLERVMKLRPVTYRWKDGSLYRDDGVVHEGFIADELQQVIPSAVTYKKDEVGEDGKPHYQSIAPLEVLPVLTKAIQELKADNDNLRAEFEAYKAAHP